MLKFIALLTVLLSASAFASAQSASGRGNESAPTATLVQNNYVRWKEGIVLSTPGKDVIGLGDAILDKELNRFITEEFLLYSSNEKTEIEYTCSGGELFADGAATGMSSFCTTAGTRIGCNGNKIYLETASPSCVE